MEPSDRKVVQAVVRISKPDTLKVLLRRLVREGVFSQRYVDQHTQEILEIFEEFRSDAGTSSSDSDVDGRQDGAPSIRRRASVLRSYGPVDDRATASSISLFKPESGTFGFATSRHSEGDVSFIQSRTVEANNLEPEADGSVKIQWRHPSRVADDFDDRGNHTARNTWCIVLSDKEVKKLGMKVDIVFGVHHSDFRHKQKYYMPAPPWCPTPREAETPSIHPAALALRSNDSLRASNRPSRSRYRSLSSPPEQLQPLSSLDRWEGPDSYHDGHRQALYQYSGPVSDDDGYGQPDRRPSRRPKRRNRQSSSSRSSGRPSRKQQRRRRGLAGLRSITDDILEWIDRCLNTVAGIYR